MADQITVVYTDGRRDTVGEPTLPDLVAFERHFGESATILDGDGDKRLEWVAFIVWRSVTRSMNGDRPDFEAWLETVASLEAEKAEGVDPTSPEPQPG